MIQVSTGVISVLFKSNKMVNKIIEIGSAVKKFVIFVFHTCHSRSFPVIFTLISEECNCMALKYGCQYLP